MLTPDHIWGEERTRAAALGVDEQREEAESCHLARPLPAGWMAPS